MNAISAGRKALAQTMTDGGVKTFPNVPMQINTARAVALAPAPDYVLSTLDFGSDVAVTLHAYCLVKPKNAEADLDALDGLLVDVAAVLEPTVWSITACDEPDVLTYGDWSLYGARLTLTATL